MRVPVRLLLGGAKHSAGPPADEVRMLATGLPEMTIDTVPGAGHHLAEERPDRVVEALIGAAAVAAAIARLARPVAVAGHGQGTGAEHFGPVLTKPARSALSLLVALLALTGCTGWQAVQLTPASFSPPPAEMRVTRLDGWQGACLAAIRGRHDTRAAGGRALRLDRHAGIASAERGGADAGGTCHTHQHRCPRRFHHDLRRHHDARCPRDRFLK